MRRGGSLQSGPVSAPAPSFCDPRCLPFYPRVGSSSGGAVSNPKAGKRVSPSPSIPSKRTTSEGFSDSGPSRRPTTDSRRMDSTQGRTKTPIASTIHPPRRPTFNPEITPSMLQPTVKAVAQTTTMFGSVPHFRFRPQDPSDNIPGSFTPPSEHDETLPMARMTKPQAADSPRPWTVVATSELFDRFPPS